MLHRYQPQPGSHGELRGKYLEHQPRKPQISRKYLDSNSFLRMNNQILNQEQRVHHRPFSNHHRGNETEALQDQQ